MTPAVWSAPVRYAEVDAQKVVFNAHYLLYCDEAMSAFCAARGVLELAERARLVASTLNWRSSARWGDVVEVDAACPRIGTSSFVLDFVVRVGERVCCEISTTYVYTDADERPAPVPADARARLVAESGGGVP